MPPTAADADAVLAKEQTVEATALWLAGDFDAAHQTLQRLDVTLPSDAKVHLNLLTAGYYADTSICSSLEGLAEQLAAWLDSHALTAAHATHTGYAVAAVNYGIILYLQQQHAKALAVLEPLFENVEALHEGTAACLCVLLLEIYLGSMQLPKAVEVLQYLQAAAAPPKLPEQGDHGGQEAAGTSSPSQARSPQREQQQQQHQPQQQHQHQEPPQGLKRGSESPQQSQKQQQRQQQLPQQLQRQQQQLAPDQDAEPSLDLPIISRTESDFIEQVGQLVQQQGGGRLQRLDLAAVLHLYKARLALACNNHRAAKRELRALLGCQPDSAASSALLLKAQLEVMRQQPKKALKTLAPLLATVSQGTVRCRLQLLNLLAALHDQLGKHHVAALYLTTALTQHQQAQQQQRLWRQQLHPSCDEQQQQGEKPLQHKKQQQKGRACSAAQSSGTAAATSDAGGSSSSSSSFTPGSDVDVQQSSSRWLLLDMSDALSYNLGLQQLTLQHWQAALECFEAASSKYFTQPQLWLRMAEASLGLYKAQQQQQQQELSCFDQGSSGTGPGAGSTARGDDLKQQQESSSSILQQAALHLSTGLTLLQEQQEAAAKQLEAAAAATAAAIAAGEQPPLSLGEPPLLSAAAAAAAGMGAAQNGPIYGQQEQAALAAASSSFAEAAAAAAAAGPSTPTAATTPLSALSSLPDADFMVPEMAAVKQSLLANQAYVHLLLHEPEAALTAAQALLACSSMSPQLHYVASSYAAEALCMLGRVDEAKQQLQSHMSLFSGYSSSSGVLASTASASSQPPQHAAAAAGLHGSAAGINISTSATVAAGQQGVAAGVACSIKSDDGSSCAGCGPGLPCGSLSSQAGQVLGHQGHAAASGLRPHAQAELFSNLSVVLAMQGNVAESERFAGLAAGLGAGASSAGGA